MRLIWILFCCFSLFGADYDCIFVGSGPFSLCEALYQSSQGKKVLILEQQKTCGGAWKAIEVCGLPNVDLGCHTLGSDPIIADFLRNQLHCNLVSQNKPWETYNAEIHQDGYYFSGGCFEFINNLLTALLANGVEIQTSAHVETFQIDRAASEVKVICNERYVTASKLFLTQASVVQTENQTQQIATSKYYHLYLLIADNHDPKFTQMTERIKGVSRAMNLTFFSGLAGTGKQIIVLQISSADELNQAGHFFEDNDQR